VPADCEASTGRRSGRPFRGFVPTDRTGRTNIPTIFAVGQAGGPIVAGLLADLTGSLAPGLLCGACTDAAGLAVAWWVRRDSRS